MSNGSDTTEYKVFGQKDEAEGKLSAQGVTTRVITIRLSETRAEGAEVQVEVRNDDVVAVELDGGFSLWMRGDDLRNELGEETRDGELTLRPRLGARDSERGVAGWLLKGLKIFGFDPVDGLVRAAAQAIEREDGNLLLRLDPAASQPSAREAWKSVDGSLPPTKDNEPLLIFLHGTFSSTLGSFGELFKAPGPAGALQAGYPGRIYGFEHRTLTESPIANALALVERLPADARLHLASHSRGGLVGDLLCLTPVISEQGLLSPKDLERFSPDDRRDLPKLIEQLREKRPRVERFVRVASPSRGTTLASGRLDRWLSVVSHLISKVPLLGGPIADAVQELILAMVKERTDPETLPGLAAMMPSAPLVGFLNRTDVSLAEPLAVISGDIQEQGLWGRLKLLLPDLFFAGDHDLVVNTGSMYGGLRRAQGWYCFDQGATVNHFNYFGISDQSGTSAGSQPITVDALLLGLLGEPPGRFYRPLAEAPVIAPARSAAGVTGRRPVLFVLPGIMGSALAVRDASEEVWLSIRRLALGQLERLRIDQPLPIKPTGLLGLAYGDLLEFMDRSHDVLPFPYDWRRSVREAAGLLAEEVDRALDQTETANQPVRILAHSMGGLVARAMIAERPDLWQRILARGGRLVMLGTPNRGSWEIVRLLVAQASTLKQLALLDVTKDRQGLLAIIHDFPGVLELLPEDRRDFFSDGIWRRLRAHDEDEEWSLPGQGRPGASGPTWLEQAREARAWLRDRAIDPQGMIYVAGQAPETASEVVETSDRRWPRGERKRLAFFVSQRGDSSVLWDDGLLPGVPTWYAPGIGHGDLAKDRGMFGAIEDLLEQGRTEARVLQREAPVSRGEDVPREMADREPAYYPDEDMLVRTALAISPPRPRAAVGHGVQVSVTHGSLGFAEHRVAVGHYEGDTIIAAEAYLDHVLGGRLSARHALGLYPGAAGTHALFDHPSPKGKPLGALVVGLGEVGQLTPSLLSASFARALLELARQIVEGGCHEAGDHSGQPYEMALSSLLIGTGAGGISVQDSMLALLRGVVEANNTLEQAGQADKVRIAAIEFIELWEDRAIGAARALRQIDRDPELAGIFEVKELVRQGTGGNRGVRASGEDQAWWHRLQVRANEQGALRFTLLTQRARAEETLVSTQAELLDRFVARASASTGYDPELNRTLFEMLLPNRLKDGSVLRSNLVLVLDQDAARFPWEMIEDRWSQPLPGLRATSRAERGDGRKPGAVEFGMLRQLATRTYRGQPVMSLDRRALVVGDPRSDFVPLPGARDEARRVAGQLEQTGYRVTALIEPSDEQVMLALHGDAYQILHLAGHGVHRHRLESRAKRPCDACGQPLPEREQDLVSGMIIGEGMVLTPGDVQQMRRVPDLVFLNCCHLGRADDKRKDSDRGQVHRLAANLAVQFIEMGVRAVIAAGWAVNDRAALTFAETFYRQMADGRRFGDAVRLARSQTWQEHRAVNTWGAYQCYGDPDFSLGGGARRGQGPEPILYVCPAEMVADLDNLRADAQTASPPRIAQLREDLRRIEQAVKEIAAKTGANWRERGEVAEALGLAQGEVGRFADAVATLDGAIGAVDARASWNAIEQRARYQARYAKELCLRGDDASRQQGQSLFDAALASLRALERDPLGNPTVERYRSETGIHWRRVQTLPAGEREAELERLVSVFERAAVHLNRGGVDPLDPYSRLLWLTGKLMLSAYSAKRLDDLCPTFPEWCAELERRSQQYERECPGASADAIQLEVRLLRLVEQGALTDALAGELIAELHGILTRGVSQRQLSSILDYVELLQILADGATHKKKGFRPQAVPLGLIAEALRAWEVAI
jgi:pimeloyl-ACP methyl ester carboxylesterase